MTPTEKIKEELENIELIKEELNKVNFGKRVKCIYCGKNIHINDFGGITKNGLFCNKFFCLLKSFVVYLN